MSCDLFLICAHLFVIIDTYYVYNYLRINCGSIYLVNLIFFYIFTDYLKGY